MIDDTQKELTVMNQRHTNDELQSMEMVLPPGIFTIRVKVLDLYDSCNELIIIEDLEVINKCSVFIRTVKPIYSKL